VGPLVVVLVYPGAECLLGEGEVVEDLTAQELVAQGAVEALGFPVGARGARRGQAVDDAVLLLEKDLGGAASTASYRCSILVISNNAGPPPSVADTSETGGTRAVKHQPSLRQRSAETGETISRD
jgi:hypothetical protein